MKNKIRMIDINFASAYMGRFLTLGVTVLVVAVTVSALVSGGGLRDHRTLILEVPGGVHGGPEARFGPFRDLLAAETGRAVRERVRQDGWCDECDLFVFPIIEFIDGRALRDLVPLYAIERMKRGRDAAVLIARAGEALSDSIPPADEIMFSHPRSFNGFWLQLEVLESRGFHAPEKLQSLRFAPASDTGIRVAYAVALGDCVVGACRASDVAEAEKQGGIERGELSVIHSTPAVPEVIVACRPDDVDYYRNLLAQTAAQIAAPEPDSRWREAVELLESRGMRSLRPVSREEVARAVSLRDAIEKRFPGGGL
jgi:hypothetical protein